MDNKITNWSFKTEMERSFLDYSLSVIISRALPDVKDGLKPVHRRILWAMHDAGNISSSPYRKSATTVGNVIASYHPHGDAAIYESMVRMAQDFSLRHVLIQGQGNFGSIDGDSAAAMRYTEARLSKISTFMLEDIRKDTIDWRNNYDGTTKEPVVLPSKFPNILVNGSEGIAVGMATSIPTHNLIEVINAVKAIMEDSNISIQELCEIVTGPDFPTRASIMGKKGIYQAYQTGRGSVRIRSKAVISEDQSKIIIKELPYQVNKAKLVEKFAELANPNHGDEVLSRIKVIRDESDSRDGIRIVIELKRDANADLVLSHLYKKTQLETNHSINMVLIVDGVPRTLNIKEVLMYYLQHQRDVVIRRTKFELNKAEKRAHLLSGFLRALDIIDRIVLVIKGSKNKEEAQKNLISEFDFSDVQSLAIVEMQLYRLTGLEKNRLQKEYDEIIELIKDLKDILSSSERVDQIIVDKFDEIVLKFGEPRNTEILDYNEDGIDEDLIPRNDLILTLTNNMYVKTTLESEFSVQNRAGKGSNSQKMYDDDEIELSLNIHSHSNLLFFSDKNKVYRTKAYNIGVSNKTTRGTSIFNVISLDKDEKILKIVEVKENNEGYIVFVTKNGKIKKTPISEYERINKNGKKYSNYNDGDSLADAFFATEKDFVQVVSSNNYAITFALDILRPMSRIANGVRAMKVDKGYVASATPILLDGLILTITDRGFGKLTKITDIRTSSDGKEINKGFSPKNRGGKGMIISKRDDKIGSVIFNKYIAVEDLEDTFVLLMTNKGKTLKTKLSDVSIVSRTSRGNIIQRLSDDEVIKAVTLSTYNENNIEVDNEEDN